MEAFLRGEVLFELDFFWREGELGLRGVGAKTGSFGTG